METILDTRKMRGVQHRVLDALKTNEFAGPEILFGLAEVLGRLTVELTNGTWIEKQAVYKELCAHIERTIKAGLAARN